MTTIKGECACGKVQIEVPTPVGSGLCHCTDCRKSGGGPASINLMCPRDQVNVSGDDLKTFAKAGDSGATVTRSFCGHCGSQIMSQTESATDFTFVRAGLFPPGSIPSPNIHLFTKNFESWEMPIAGTAAFKEGPPRGPE